jgi:S1-C subfamily serine protease
MNDYRTVPTSVDIITAIDGKSLKSINDLISYLAANTEPGQTVSLDVLRNGTETLQVNVVLSPRP